MGLPGDMNRVVSTAARLQAAKRLGSFLRELRQGKGWTQRQAAESVGVDSVTIRRWELGTFSPSQDNMDRLSRSYDVSTEDFLNAANPPTLLETEARVPVRGYVNAGVSRLDNDVDLNEILLPKFITDAHSNAFAVVVSGDSLTEDGIHSEDILVIDPDTGPVAGALQVVSVESVLFVATCISSVEMRLRTSSGRSEVLDVQPPDLFGTVVWHIRRMLTGPASQNVTSASS